MRSKPNKKIICRVCRVCRKGYIPTQAMQKVCGVFCALAHAVSNRGKAEKVAQIKERKDDAATRLRQKIRSKWMAEAKTAIQQARRLEELAKGRGCMSCKRTRQEVESGAWRPGGYWDGGHFRGKGAHPELALEPLNIWLQCKSCNAGSGKYARKGHTVNAAFEANLIEAEGQALVDWLNGPHPLKHYETDDLIAIKKTYNAKTKTLKDAKV